MNARWLPVAGFPAYEVSSAGEVRSAAGKLLKPSKTKDGYMRLKLSRNGRAHNALVHRLVLEAFVGPCPADHECRHFPDRSRSNNRLDNVQWGTREENTHDRHVHGTTARGSSHGLSLSPERRARGSRHGRSRLSEPQVIEALESLRGGETGRSVAARLGVTPAAISAIKRGRVWNHITQESGQ